MLNLRCMGSRTAALLCVAVFLALSGEAAYAQSDPIIQTVRTFTNDITGTTDVIDPAATYLDVTVTFTDVNPDPLGSKTITAFGFQEYAMPPGWTYDSIVAAQPSPPYGGVFENGWFYVDVPALPFSFTYRLNALTPLTGLFDFSGDTSYTTDGGPVAAQFDNTQCISPTSTIAVSRVVTDGLCRWPTYYNSDTTLTVKLSIRAVGGVSAPSELGLIEVVPTGWLIVPNSVSGASVPENILLNASGNLEVSYTFIPTFPASFSYQIAIPAMETGTKSFSTFAQYRLGAGDVISGLSRTTELVNDTAPTLMFNGIEPMTIECGYGLYSIYDLWSASDLEEGNLDSRITFDTSAISSRTPGSYPITVNVSDSCGNTVSETRTINVVDTSAPQIWLRGSHAVIGCGTTYLDAGAVALDACDGMFIPINSVISTVPNPATPGNWTVTYNTTDSSGNAAPQVVRNVTVQDTGLPVITITGGDAIIECGSTYVDAGATALDDCNGDLTASIVSVSTVPNPATVGNYTVTYDVSDSTGNTAIQVLRNVIVTTQDTTAPIITLIGGDTTTECGQSYTDQGATADDACNGNLDASIIVGGDIIDTATPGVYTITYAVSDSNGNNAAQVTRTVTVQDTTDPVITLVGGNSMTVDCEGVFTDPGFSAWDACTGDLSASVLVAGSVDTNDPGEYTLTYDVSDINGNAAQVIRTVTVLNNCTLGASCFPDGTCFELREEVCLAFGGTYQGDDTTCELAPCPQPGEGEGEGEIMYTDHSADQDDNHMISLTELLRLIQFFNLGPYHCDVAGEDGFNPGVGDQTCAAHFSDYNPQDWSFSLLELLRLIQIFNLGGYVSCPIGGTEDGFCPIPVN